MVPVLKSKDAFTQLLLFQAGVVSLPFLFKTRAGGGKLPFLKRNIYLLLLLLPLFLLISASQSILGKNSDYVTVLQPYRFHGYLEPPAAPLKL